jgi:hypothetical protein
MRMIVVRDSPPAKHECLRCSYTEPAAVDRLSSFNFRRWSRRLDDIAAPKAFVCPLVWIKLVIFGDDHAHPALGAIASDVRVHGNPLYVTHAN